MFAWTHTQITNTTKPRHIYQSLYCCCCGYVYSSTLFIHIRYVYFYIHFFVEFELSAKLFGLNYWNRLHCVCFAPMLVRIILASMHIVWCLCIVLLFFFFFLTLSYSIYVFVRGHCFIHQIKRRQIRISVTIFVKRILCRNVNSLSHAHTYLHERKHKIWSFSSLLRHLAA